MCAVCAAATPRRLLFLLAAVVSVLFAAYPQQSAMADAVPKIYWTEAEFGKIERAKLDGSGVEDVLMGLGQPIGIAVDSSLGSMYWTEQFPPRIRRANLEGGFVADLIAAPDVNFPKSIALDLAAGKMYWTDNDLSGAGKISRANLDGTNVEDVLTSPPRPWQVFPPTGSATGIALDSASAKMYWTAGRTVYRSNLDSTQIELLVDFTQNGRSWFNNIALDPAAHSMYWTDQGSFSDQGTIWRANLDGSDAQAMVTRLGQPLGITLDTTGNKLYWTDVVTDKIQRSNLDGSGIEDLVTATSGVSIPSGLALASVTPPVNGVGGTVEILAPGPNSSQSQASGSSPRVLPVALAAGEVVLALVAWYGRRRWLR
jgi:sugar lactone lactonase YvrE